MHRTPTTAGFFILATKQADKIINSPETWQYCEHKPNNSLKSTYVSSRCCSNVDSIISGRKQQLNLRFMSEVLLFILKTLVRINFRVPSDDCHVHYGNRGGPNYTKSDAKTITWDVKCNYGIEYKHNMCYELHFLPTILIIIWAYEFIKMNNTNKLNLA